VERAAVLEELLAVVGGDDDERAPAQAQAIEFGAQWIHVRGFDEFKEKRFASPPLLKRMVMAGWYGKKNGKGFLVYCQRYFRLYAPLLK